jgi:hypothetical protein
MVGPELMIASTDSSENDTVWATASEGGSEEDQQYVQCHDYLQSMADYYQSHFTTSKHPQAPRIIDFVFGLFPEVDPGSSRG